jgi:hypothetical protein
MATQLEIEIVEEKGESRPYLEIAHSPRALSMHHTLRDALTVEVRQVVDQVEVLCRGGEGEVR